MTNNQQTLFDMVQVWIIADRKGARTCNFARIELTTLKVRDVLSLQGVGIGVDETDKVIDKLQQFWAELNK